MGRMASPIVSRECEACGATFSVKANNPKKACSRECSNALKTGRKPIKHDMIEKSCIVCGKAFTVPDNSRKATCSRHCQSLTPRKRLSGDEHPMRRKEVVEKVVATTKARYSKEELIQRKNQTMLERYGVEHASQVPKFKEKAVRNTDYAKVQESLQATMLERYGSKNAMQVASSKKKANATRWGQDHNQIYKDIRTQEWWDQNYIGKKVTLRSLCEKFHVGESILSAAAHELDVEIINFQGRSFIENKLAERLSDLGLRVRQSCKSIIGPKEIDIALPDFKVGIEVNGIYWHSVKARGTPKNYHAEKYEMMKEKGWRLLQFWDTEVEGQFELVVSMIMNACHLNNVKIGARQCLVQSITNAVANAFLDKNHLQRRGPAAPALGLFKGNRLVCVCKYGASRYRSGYTEIVRFASERGVSVQGGFQKLLKHVPAGNGVLSYSDNRYATGAAYEKAGFVVKHRGSPTPWFTRDYSKLLHRSSVWTLRSRDDYDVNKTQMKNAFDMGFDVVYDAGQITWSLEKS